MWRSAFAASVLKKMNERIHASGGDVRIGLDVVLLVKKVT
jgi:hypothetical protein